MLLRAGTPFPDVPFEDPFPYLTSCHSFQELKILKPIMRAGVFFLLPFLGSCRHLAPRGEVSDPKRQLFNDAAVSVCYTYTTTYLTTLPAGPSAGGSGKLLLSVRSLQGATS